MMTKDQEQDVREIYRHFINNDHGKNWTKIDDLLWELDFLNDEQTIIETETQIYLHSLGTIKCSEDHGQKKCLVPQLLDAVNIICESYQKTKRLHPKNKYILQNYLAVSYQKIIDTDTKE